MTIKVQRGKIRAKKMKPRKIYLKEPHDYFGINYFLRMQERQRQLETQGSLESFRQDYRKNYCKPINGIVPSTCWRAYDLHNKPRSLYSDEEKKLAALEVNFYKKTAVSVPLNEVIANKFKRYFAQLVKIQCEAVPLVAQGTCENPTMSRKSTARGQTLRKPTSSRGHGPRKHVRFAPDTVFSESNEKPCQLNLMERRELKGLRKSEEDEMMSPRPYLPFLESGLSYHDDEEFYRLKNSEAHRVSHRIVNRSREERSNRCWGVVVKTFRHLFCCIPEIEEGASAHSNTRPGSYPYHHDPKTF